MKNHLTHKNTKHTQAFFANFPGVKKSSKNLTPKPDYHTHVRSGFTMVELSLTLAFIGVLLITIAIITTNIVSIYQKGMTLKAINSVGRGLIDELTSAINTAPSVDTTSLCNSLVAVGPNGDRSNIDRCIKDHAFNYIFHASTNDEGEQYNGVFCTGYYSYIWNTYYSETSEQSHSLKLKYLPIGATSMSDAITTEAPRLMRVEDRNYRVCSAVMKSDYNSNFSSNMTIDITTLAHSTESNPLPNYTKTPTEGMLDEFDLDLTLYEFTIFPISQDSVTLRTYMSGTFILATLRGDVDIMRNGDYCSLGTQIEDEDGDLAGDTGSLNNLGSEFNYCAINKFNFAARTAGV